MLKAVLEDDYAVETATTGEQAMPLLIHGAFELLITDRMLPGKLTGENLLRRAVDLEPPVPVILITGMKTTDSVLESFRSGVSEYLHKPIDLDLLPDIVKNVLSQSSNESSGLNLQIPRDNWIELTANTFSGLEERFWRFCDLLYATAFDDKTKNAIRLAVEELGKNALEWGNQGDCSKQIRITFCIFPDQLVLKIEDEGEGFSPEALMNPADDLKGMIDKRESEGKRMGGFGIHMVKSTMDEVIYSDKGNVVLCVKHLEDSE